MFKGNAQIENRDELVNDLSNMGAKALEFYRKPMAMAGGGYTFMGFALLPSDTGNQDGSFAVTPNVPSGADYIPGGTTSIPSPVQTIYITACGKETGTDGVNKVKVFITVTADSEITSVLN